MNASPPNVVDQLGFVEMPRSSYDYGHPLQIPRETKSATLLSSLLETAAFKRLEGVSFLGALDYNFVPHPNGAPSVRRFTRAQHSLGVLQLAIVYCRIQDLSPADRDAVCAAALLHDIGHPPFSHSMEQVFAEKFGMDHHRATQDIICGRNPLRRDVFRILRSHNVDTELVAALVAGDVSDFDRFFSGPITFDTIEGISRSYGYLRRRVPPPNALDIVVAATQRMNARDRRLVDNFWRLKHHVYRYVVHSHRGILADFAAQQLLRRHIERMCIDDYFGNDEHVFRQVPHLKEILTSKSMEKEAIRYVGVPDSYMARDYRVNEGGRFYSRQDDVRYDHVKYSRQFNAALLTPESNKPHERSGEEVLF